MSSKSEFLQAYPFQMICLLFMEFIFAGMAFFMNKESLSFFLFIGTLVSFYLTAGLFFFSMFLFKRDMIGSFMDFRSSILYVIQSGVLLSTLCLAVFANSQSRQQVNFVIYYIGVAILAGTILNSEIFFHKGHYEMVKKIAATIMTLLFVTSLFLVFYNSDYVNNFLLENGFPSYWLEVNNQVLPIIRSNPHYTNNMNFFSFFWLFFTLYLGIGSVFNQIKTTWIKEMDVERFHSAKPVNQRLNAIKLIIMRSLFAHLILVSFVFYLFLALIG